MPQMQVEPRDDQNGSPRIRLILLDDHSLFRESLARLLASQTSSNSWRSARRRRKQ